ncbi:MAG TPA: sensor domain-containing protein, partial [Ktedonobacterales bacterium]|nr:sensor domain-containing protein [Ktedonobacterales bacterium]
MNSTVGVVIGVVWRRQTWLNLAYLLATLPLGLFYFTVLVTGISIGMGMAVIGIGLVVLLLTMACWWGLAIFERHLVMWWLGVPIAPMAPPAPSDRTWWDRVRATLANPVTWKSLAYLFIEFPFGIFAFTATITVLSIALTALAYPLIYLLGTAIYAANPGGPAGSMFYGISLNGHVEAASLAVTLLVMLLGVVLTLGALHALNGLAWGWGQFARLMLGMSQGARRLAEARAVAERERARAERADQTRRELIVNVSHELRTPIASIRGHVESLLTPATEPPAADEAQRYLGIVARETERLGALVDDLLALARADAHELKLEVRPVAVGAVVEEVYQALEPLAHRERQVTLVRHVPAHLPLALADRDRLAQVLLNLVRNAITYTPEGGIVSIALEQPDPGHLAVAVSDTGAGIAPEELERVFDRFYRTD